jgi:iron complex outermembrane receptor protein
MNHCYEVKPERRKSSFLHSGFIMKKAIYGLLFLFTLVSTGAFAQERVVTGSVREANGDPMPGVSILVKGTTNGTQTDSQGNFSIRVADNAILVFSFIGKSMQEVAVGNQTTLAITLEDDLKTLGEVVVIGYGTQKKEDLTGSIATVSTKDFVQGPITNPEQLITGKVAGLQITSGGGQPGTGTTIRIRGGASLNASNDPLIVIDGVPLDNNGLSGASNALSFINPNDIESYNILKDASATAIYGSRASNGVIIITTKKGKSGEKFKVDFSTLNSIGVKTKNVDVLSANDFRNLVIEKGNAAQKALLGNANTNWQNQIYQQAFTSDNNLSIMGNVKSLAMPYRVSGGYLNQDGILKTSNMERYSGAIGLSPKFFDDHLKVDLNLKGTIINNRFADQGAIGAAVVFDPTQPVYSDSKRFGGYFEWLDPSTNNPNTLATKNPLSLLNMKSNTSNVKRSIGNIVLDYRFPFLPELNANLNMGYDISSSDGKTYTDSSSAAGFAIGGNGGSIGNYQQKKTNRTLEFYLKYVKDLDFLKSKIEATAGYSYQDFWRRDNNYSQNFKGNNVNAPIPYSTKSVLVSFYGRLNYSILNKYLLTFTLRDDGSSRFSKDTRWGLFPSAAFAWKIKEETFLKNINAVSELKLRLGYGITGQQSIFNDYPYLARYTLSAATAQYPFGNTYYPTYRPEGYDPNIKWEETTTYNAGFDYGILNGRIYGSIDYYFKQTKDLLADVPVSAGTNFKNTITTNVGRIENKGLELAINASIIQKKDFSLDAGFNITFYDTKITKLREVADTTSQGVLVGGISGGVGNTIQIHTVGYQPYSFYVYKQVYNEAGKPVEGLYEDINKDGKITSDDRYRYKSPASKMFFGFTTNLRYKDLSAGFVLRGNIGNYVYNNVSSANGANNNFANPNNFLSNVYKSILFTQFANSQYFSDYYMENASFLRMDNVNISYNLSRLVSDKIRLRVSANVQNVFVVTKYKGLDPEISGGIDSNLYPRPRVYSLGVNVGF